MIQNHPPTPVRNSKYLAIPPTYPLPLRNIKMAPNEFNYAGEIQYDFRFLIMIVFFDVIGQIRALLKT